MDEYQLSFMIVLIVVLGVAAQWLAWRFRFPAIVLLALAGLIIGPVTGWVSPREVFGEHMQSVVSLCVAIILFEGGLNLHFNELKVAASGVRRLVYLGAPLAWFFATLAAVFVGGLSWQVAAVFGAIMVVTGPTVIIPLLRQARLNRRTASYFKWEGIVNDPIGALLAVLILQFLVQTDQDSGWQAVVTGLSWALASGAFLGGAGGWLAGKAFRRGLVPEYLKSPVMLGLVLLVFVTSNLLQHEAGLLAVTVMGMVVGNMDLAGIQDMKRFKEYITVMLVAVVFVVLTADLQPEVLLGITWHGIALVAAILFLCRPATVFFATLGADMDNRDRAILGWIAPRGIVAAATAGVMGPRLQAAGYEGAESLLPLVFLVIFATILLHGSTIGWIARKLQLTSRNQDSILIVGASPWSVAFARKLKELGVRCLIADSSWHNLRRARLAGIDVFYGEILSDFAEESVEIGHVGTVLAATSNDAYNALVCMAIAPEVGRPNVFQLAMGDTQSDDDPRGVARPLRGRVAFGTDAVFEKLWRRHVRGWTFYSTRLSETYSYSDFLGDCPQDTMVILRQQADGKMVFFSPDVEIEPQA
ncbi:MAG: sodium:proton antiporter, partial [Gammaproteobacteria bacterium]|nr:sodium:proton antiporter [Gammaproteobacteria bacterium]